MYYIINKTTKQTLTSTTWDDDLINNLLDDDMDIIVVSTYSNTIKIPYVDTELHNHGLTRSGYEWSWKEYPLPAALTP